MTVVFGHDGFYILHTDACAGRMTIDAGYPVPADGYSAAFALSAIVLLMLGVLSGGSHAGALVGRLDPVGHVHNIHRAAFATKAAPWGIPFPTTDGPAVST